MSDTVNLTTEELRYKDRLSVVTSNILKSEDPEGLKDVKEAATLYTQFSESDRSFEDMKQRIELLENKYNDQ